MANEIRIKAEPRTASGSGAARRLRRAGFVPAAVNRIAGASEALQIDAHTFVQLLRHHDGEHMLMTLETATGPIVALLREVQRDVLDGLPIHADFGEVDMTKKLRSTIGLRLAGEPEGVRTQGGVLTQALRDLVVECLPTDLVDAFTIDVSHLKVNESLLVRDLKLGAQYTVMTHGELPVAAVVEIAEEEAAPAAAGAEGEAAAAGAAGSTEPEVIAKGKKEEEAAAEAAAAPKKK